MLEKMGFGHRRVHGLSAQQTRRENGVERDSTPYALQNQPSNIAKQLIQRREKATCITAIDYTVIVRQ